MPTVMPAVATPPESAVAPAPRRAALRVCMIHHSDFHVDSRIQRQARALAERGDEVHLVCLSADAELACGDGRIIVHRAGREKASGGAAGYLGGYAHFVAAAFMKVAALDRRLRFDLVEAHNMPDAVAFAGLAPRLRGVPLILNVHDTFPELFATRFGRSASHPAVRAVILEERGSAAIAQHVITVTDVFRERLELRGVGRGRITVVMNSPDEGLFGPQRQPRPLPQGRPVRILYHGGLAPRFGVDVLLEAVAALGSGVELRVCGTGDDDRVRIIALAERLNGAGARIDVAPAAVALAAIPAELERADLGVVPTLRDDFTELLLPVKLLEYVHMGLPAIASRLPGIERHMGCRDIAFAEPGDAHSLAAAIRATLDDPAAALLRGASAAATLSRFSWARQRRRYLGLVDDLTAARTR